MLHTWAARAWLCLSPLLPQPQCYSFFCWRVQTPPVETPPVMGSSFFYAFFFFSFFFSLFIVSENELPRPLESQRFCGIPRRFEVELGLQFDQPAGQKGDLQLVMMFIPLAKQ